MIIDGHSESYVSTHFVESGAHRAAVGIAPPVIPPVVPPPPIGGVPGFPGVGAPTHAAYLTVIHLVLSVDVGVSIGEGTPAPPTPAELQQRAVRSVLTRAIVGTWPSEAVPVLTSYATTVTFSMHRQGTVQSESPGKADDDDAFLMGLFDDE